MAPVTPQQLAQYLRSKGSPLAGQAGTLVKAGQQYGVDPRLLVAISGGESAFGTKNFQPYNAWGWMSGDTYGSYKESIDAVARGLAKGYINQGLTTLPQIGAKWAPIGAGNDPTNLNSNWVRNVGQYYKELGGTPGASTGGPPLTPSARPSSGLPQALPKGLPAWASKIPGFATPGVPSLTASDLLGSSSALVNKLIRQSDAAVTPKTIRIAGLNMPLQPDKQPLAPANTPLDQPPTKGTAAVVGAAKRLLGVPYSWGGGGSQGISYGIQQGASIKGIDCSGLLQYAYAQQGVSIPRVTYDQWTTGQAVPTPSLRPGDAVFFNMGPRGPEHVGIYMGGDKFIEAPRTGLNVRVSKLSDRSDFVGGRRYG